MGETVPFWVLVPHVSDVRRCGRKDGKCRTRCEFDRVAASEQHTTRSGTSTNACTDGSTRAAARDRTDQSSESRTDTRTRDGLRRLIAVTDRTLIVNGDSVAIDGRDRLDQTGELIRPAADSDRVEIHLHVSTAVDT